MPHIRDLSDKQGPIKDKNGVPYDYIVVIDAGSRGSRAYVYNWLNPHYLNGDSPTVNLVKRVDSEDADDDNDEDDTDEDGKKGTKPKSKDKSKDKPTDKSKDKSTDKSTDKVTEKPNTDFTLPVVTTKSDWKKKIKPGLSFYKSKPKDVGSKHLKRLLKAVSKIVPDSQQYRTPIFLHATAGMRLLSPQEQKEILATACEYISKKSDFFLPDCPSHINIIDGEVEGLYGWIAMNYLMNTFQKSSATYGILDMGGASTQISFQPNEAEAAEHANALFNIQLGGDLEYSVFCASFMGYGINQAYQKYIQALEEQTTAAGDESVLINDPCMPKGLVKEDDSRVVGTGNYEECMKLIYPLLQLTENSETSSCSTDEPQDVSSCLLSEEIPKFDFNLNRFVGVSGYWDAVSHLLKYEDAKIGGAYSYEQFSAETQKICGMSWEDLDQLNDDDADESSPVSDLTDSDLKQLCFKSSWVLSVLHRGLGFPVLGENTDDSFSVSTLINGNEFTWTLGRAVLYANSEYSLALYGDKKQVGYFKGTSPNTFFLGGESKGIPARPALTASKADVKVQSESHNSAFEISHTHKLFASLVFLLVLVFGVYFLLGKKRRATIMEALQRMFSKKNIMDMRPKYKPLRSLELPRDNLELQDMTRAEEAADAFQIDDDDDDDDDGLDRAVS